MLDLPSQQNSWLKPQLCSSRVDLDSGSIGHLIKEAKEARLIILKTGGSQGIGSNVSNQEGTMRKNRGNESLTKLDRTVLEY